MTITPTRLRELIRFADDRAADTTQDYQTIQAHRDIAAAIRERDALTERLKAVEAENERLRGACEKFVTAIDSAPPIELLQHIAAAAIEARAALDATEKEQE